MNPIYILQKDLPDSKAGDEYVYTTPYGAIAHAAYYKNGNPEESYWTAKFVENNIEWFKPKDSGRISNKEARKMVLDIHETLNNALERIGKLEQILSDSNLPYKPIEKDIKWSGRKETNWPEGILSFAHRDKLYYADMRHALISYQSWVDTYLNIQGKIHSVKNNIGEVLTVGAETNKGKIDEFYVNGFLVCLTGNKHNHINDVHLLA